MTRLMLAAVGTVTLVLSGCGMGDSHEQLYVAYLADLNTVADTLEAVQSAGDVDAASRKAESLAASMEDLAARRAKLPPITSEEDDKLRKNHYGPTNLAMRRIDQVMPRQDATPEAADRMNAALKRITAVSEQFTTSKSGPPGGMPGRPGPGGPPGGMGPGGPGGPYGPPGGMPPTGGPPRRP